MDFSLPSEKKEKKLSQAAYGLLAASIIHTVINIIIYDCWLNNIAIFVDTVKKSRKSKFTTFQIAFCECLKRRNLLKMISNLIIEPTCFTEAFVTR